MTPEFLASIVAATQRAASKASTDPQFAMARDELQALVTWYAENPPE